MEYYVGETIILSLEIKKDNEYYDPNTEVSITIIEPSGTAGIIRVNMIRDDIGQYRFDYPTTAHSQGKYFIIMRVEHGSRVRIVKENFSLRL